MLRRCSWGRRVSRIRELNDRANRLAQYLREQVSVPESLIGVYLDRCFDTVVSLLAILKSGCGLSPARSDDSLSTGWHSC